MFCEWEKLIGPLTKAIRFSACVLRHKHWTILKYWQMQSCASALYSHSSCIVHNVFTKNFQATISHLQATREKICHRRLIRLNNLVFVMLLSCWHTCLLIHLSRSIYILKERVTLLYWTTSFFNIVILLMNLSSSFTFTQFLPFYNIRQNKQYLWKCTSFFPILIFWLVIILDLMIECLLPFPQL